MKLLQGLLLCLLSLSAVAAEPPVLLIVGDSISAGYGISAEQGWVTLLAKRLKAEGYPYQVINASISGDTTAGGLSRLPAALDRYHPELVLIELGGNDGLRAQSLSQMQANLERMVALDRKAKAETVLFEMRIPSNYGPVYTTKFTEAFSAAAKAGKAAALVPFFLMPLVTDPTLFQDDGIHPTAAAQAQLLEATWPTLLPLLKK